MEPLKKKKTLIRILNLYNTKDITNKMNLYNEGEYLKFVNLIKVPYLQGAESSCISTEIPYMGMFRVCVCVYNCIYNNCIYASYIIYMYNVFTNHKFYGILYLHY